VRKDQDVLFDHSRQYHSRDSDGGTDIDRDNVREFGRLRFRKVHRVRVRLPDVVYCANGKVSMKTRGK
jgi:hypothetical protein